MIRTEGQRRVEVHRTAEVAVAVSCMLALGAAAGVYSVKNGNAALIVSGLVLAASFMLLKDAHDGILGSHRWIPYAWVALCLAPDFRFTFRSTFDNSVSSATLENFVQVAVYTLVAGLILHSRRLLVAQEPRRLRTGPLLAWPVIALASTVWSLVPLFTFIRALQLLVPIGLALLTVRFWLRSPEVGRAIWKDTLRLFVKAVTILIVIGFATGFWREPRFTWPGTHPGVAPMYIGVAFLIVAAGGRSFLSLRPSGYVLRLVLFGTALYLGETRGAAAGILVAIAVMLWLAARTQPLKSYLGITYYLVAVGLVLIAARPEIMQYALRGGTAEGITTLNGRIPLWSLAIDLVNDAGRWVLGFGYGSARVILPKFIDWAGTAHSAWVEILMAIGILGPLLLAIDVLYVLRHAWSREAFVPPSVSVSILAFLLVMSITGEGLVVPGIAFVLLALLHVPVLAKRNSEAVNLGTRAVVSTKQSVASHSHAALAGNARRQPSGP